MQLKKIKFKIFLFSIVFFSQVSFVRAAQKTVGGELLPGGKIILDTCEVADSSRLGLDLAHQATLQNGGTLSVPVPNKTQQMAIVYPNESVSLESRAQDSGTKKFHIDQPNNAGDLRSLDNKPLSLIPNTSRDMGANFQNKINTLVLPVQPKESKFEYDELTSKQANQERVTQSCRDWAERCKEYVRIKNQKTEKYDGASFLQDEKKIINLNAKCLNMAEKLQQAYLIATQKNVNSECITRIKNDLANTLKYTIDTYHLAEPGVDILGYTRTLFECVAKNGGPQDVFDDVWDYAQERANPSFFSKQRSAESASILESSLGQINKVSNALNRDNYLATQDTVKLLLKSSVLSLEDKNKLNEANVKLVSEYDKQNKDALAAFNQLKSKVSGLALVTDKDVSEYENNLATFKGMKLLSTDQQKELLAESVKLREKFDYRKAELAAAEANRIKNCELAAAKIKQEAEARIRKSRDPKKLTNHQKAMKKAQQRKKNDKKTSLGQKNNNDSKKDLAQTKSSPTLLPVESENLAEPFPVISQDQTKNMKQDALKTETKEEPTKTDAFINGAVKFTKDVGLAGLRQAALYSTDKLVEKAFDWWDQTSHYSPPNENKYTRAIFHPEEFTLSDGNQRPLAYNLQQLSDVNATAPSSLVELTIKTNTGVPPVLVTLNEQIGKVTVLNARIREQAGDNQVVQNGSNIVDSFNSLATFFSDSGDIDMAVASANLAQFTFINNNDFLKGLPGKAVSGVSKALSPENYKKMASSVCSTSVMVMAKYAESQAVLETFDLEKLNGYAKKQHEEFVVIKKNVQDSFDTLKNMSWQELTGWSVEHGAEFLTNCVTLNAFSKVLSAGNALAGKTVEEVTVLSQKLSTALKAGGPVTQEYLVEIAGIGKIVAKDGIEIAKKTAETIKNNPGLLGQESKTTSQVLKEVSEDVAKSSVSTPGLVQESKVLVETCKEAIGLKGKEFEAFLTKKLGGKSSFTFLDREFDGAIGNRWYEAKSGKYWDMLQENSAKLEKFKSDMGRGLKYASQNGATYELHSNTPVPQFIKDWLVKKGIKVVEWQ